MPDTLEIVKKTDQLVDEGHIQEAIDILENHLKVIEEDSLILGLDIPIVLKNLGRYYMIEGKTQKARDIYERALEVSKDDFNRIEESDILASLAFLELKTGEIYQALKYASRAEDYIATKRGRRFATARANTLAVLGNIHFHDGNLEKALEYYKRAKVVAKKIKFKKRVVTLTLDIANIHIHKKNYIRAGDILEKSIEEAKKRYPFAVSQCYLRLGRLNTLRNRPKDAKNNIENALEYAKKGKQFRDIGECYEAMGDLYIKEGKREEAEVYYEKAMNYYKDGDFKPHIEALKKKFTS